MKINNVHELTMVSYPINRAFFVRNVNENGIQIVIPFDYTEEYEKTYYISKGNVIFIGAGIAHIVPYFNGVERLLEDGGFKEKVLYMPFSKDEYPIEEELNGHWTSLNKLIKSL